MRQDRQTKEKTDRKNKRVKQTENIVKKKKPRFRMSIRTKDQETYKGDYNEKIKKQRKYTKDRHIDKKETNNRLNQHQKERNQQQYTVQNYR